MSKSYEDFFAALQQSTIELAKAAPDDLEEQLAKSFGEAQAAFAEQLAVDLPLMPEEVSHIDLFRERLVGMADAIDAIEGGACQKIAGAGVGAETLELAKSVIGLGQVVLQCMAGDHVGLADPNEQLAEGEHLYKIGDDTGDLLIKSALP